MNTLQVLENPLNFDRVEVQMPCGLSVSEMLEQNGYKWVMDDDCPAIITLEGGNRMEEVVDFSVVPAPGEMLAVRVVPAGDGGGGKNPFSAILSVAVIAASSFFAAPLAAGLLTGNFAATAVTSVGTGLLVKGLIGGAITLAGNALVGALTGSQKQSASGVVSNSETSSTYSITGTQNTTNKYGPIPTMVGGTTRIWPTLAAEPYTEVVGEDQYLRQRFAIIGPVELSDFKIGDTDIDEYDNVELEWIQGFDGDTLPTLYADDSDISETSISASLENTSGWVVRTAPADAKEFIFDIGLSQLFFINSKGKYKSTSVEFEVSYRETDTTGDWLAPTLTNDGDSVGSSVTSYGESSVTLNSDVTEGDNVISIESTETPVVGFDLSISQAGIGSYRSEMTNVVSEGGDTYTVTLDDDIDYEFTTSATANIFVVADGDATLVEISGYYTNARLLSYRFFEDDSKQYDIRWRRVTRDYDSDDKIFDDMSISVLRAIADHPGIDTTLLPSLSVIDLRIKATGQLSGVVDQLNCLASAYLPVWDGVTTVTYTLSDSPAWAYFNILYGLANKRAITDLDRYDYESLSAWATLCEEQSWKINGILDTSTTVFAQLSTVAAIGRASVSMVDNKYGVAVDWEKDTVIQLFTPRNSWGFESTKVWPDELHAIRAQFVDEDNDYEQLEGFIYADGYDESNATLFSEQELQYVTNWDQVWKFYRYQLADRVLRPELYTFSCDIENLRCVRGDRIRIVNDIMRVGLGQARLKTLTLDGSSNVESATIDSTWPLEAAEAYAINIQLYNGTVYEGSIASPVADEDVTEITFDPVIPSTVGVSSGNLITFGISSEGVGLDLIIHEIQPGANLTAKLVCQDYAPGIQAAADGEIGSYDPQAQFGRNYLNGRPASPVIDSIQSDENVIVRDEDGHLTTRTILSISTPESPVALSSLTVQYRASGSSLWEEVGAFSATTTIVNIDNLQDGELYDFRAQVSTELGSSSEWYEVLGYTVIGKTTPPPAVDALQFTNGILTWTYSDKPIDHKGYAVRYAQRVDTNWDNGFPAHDGVLTTADFDTTKFTGDDLLFMVKAVDLVGLESEDEKRLLVNLGDAVLENIVEQTDYHPTFPGEITGGTIISSEIVADALSLFWNENNDAVFWGVDTEDYWPDNLYSLLTYEFCYSAPASVVGERLLLETSLTGDAAIFYKVLDGTGTFWKGDGELYWGDDEQNFWYGDAVPEWVPWPGSLEGITQSEYCFKIEIPQGGTQGVISEVSVVIDTPDIIESQNDVSISATTGTRLTLTTSFRVIKYVNIRALQDSGGTGVIVVDRDVDLGPLIKVVDNAEPPNVVSGVIDVEVGGY